MVSAVTRWMHASPVRSPRTGVRVAVVVGMVVAYAMSIRLKLLGYLPPTVSWTGVVLVPGLMFLTFGAVVFLPIRTPRQRVVMASVATASYLAGMGVVYWQGWH